MGQASPPSFDAAFATLTGHAPFPWQRALHERLTNVPGDNIPTSCALPTGLGKTSVIALWLIALAKHPDKMPRRLVYVVNRRTVVDQTTDEVARYRQNLGAAGLDGLLRAMCAVPLSAEESPLAISTLRGQFADNGEWAADPARPAVICGTVDMIGSRLLFSGYRSGYRTRPLHAGFLGQDTLLVHDEAHLEPAFQSLLEFIEREQRERERLANPPWRRLRVMELTATTRGDGASGASFGLSDADKEHAMAKRRLQANKRINLIPVADEKKLAEQLAERAFDGRPPGRAVLVFANKVEDVEKIRARLEKETKSTAKSPRVAQLTGTLRGWERDRLPQSPVFARFLPASRRPTVVVVPTDTVFLVCTSAGEVGVDISADDLVCDLTTFESMAQRLGRVNRYGDLNDTRVDVIHSTEFDAEDPKDQARQRTLELLRQLHGEGSPAALGQLDPEARRRAFAPLPTILPASDILFDAWALTTIRDKLPGRPPVEPYLHGVAAWEPPQTRVAWRLEVEVIQGDLLEAHKPAELLEDYPLKPHELLQDQSRRVFDRLKKLQTRRDKADAKPIAVWILSEDDGAVEVTGLHDLVAGDVEAIQYRTLLLPPSAGGLSEGMLDGESPRANDVADEWRDEQGRQLRWRGWDDAAPPSGMRRARPSIDTRPDEDEALEDESTADRLADSEYSPETPGDTEGAEGAKTRSGRFWHWYEAPRDGEGKATAAQPQDLRAHLQAARAAAEAIALRLGLPEALAAAVALAAGCHDLGKNRAAWQRAIGNLNPARPLAKSGGAMAPRELSGYRHEFGSMLDVVRLDEFQALDASGQDIVLHLIAAHHGRARPHFPTDEAFDPDQPAAQADAMAAETPRRFARLQRRFGRWGLAYLESLVRAADIAASREASTPSDSTNGDAPPAAAAPGHEPQGAKP